METIMEEAVLAGKEVAVLAGKEAAVSAGKEEAVLLVVSGEMMLRKRGQGTPGHRTIHIMVVTSLERILQVSL